MSTVAERYAEFRRVEVEPKLSALREAEMAMTNFPIRNSHEAPIPPAKQPRIGFRQGERIIRTK